MSDEREAKGLPAPGAGIGIDAGAVTCGAIGDEGRLKYAIIGDPVNCAAKIQSHTKVEGVMGLTTMACRDHALAQGYVCSQSQTERPDCVVAGVSSTVSLVVMDDPRHGAHGVPTRRTAAELLNSGFAVAGRVDHATNFNPWRPEPDSFSPG